MTMLKKPKKVSFLRKKFFRFVFISGFLGSVLLLAGCASIPTSTVRKSPPEVNTFLASRYPALPPPRERPEKIISLVDGYEEYELSYSPEDFYRLKNWTWEPAKNFKVELEAGYLLIGHTPRGATAATILPQGKLYILEKRFIGWKKRSYNSLYTRFNPAELEDIFSRAAIKDAENTERFPEAAEIIQRKDWNSYSSWTKGVGWRVTIPEPAHYVVDVDTPQEKRLVWRIKNKKSTKLPSFFLRALNTPPFQDIKISPSQARKSFRIVWENFDRIYPSFTRKGIDWLALKEHYEGKALRATTVGEFLDIIQEMLAQLKDGHIWIDTPKGSWDTYEEETFWNYNFKALRKNMESLEQLGDTILLGKTSDKLAYLAFTSWRPSAGKEVEELKQLLPDILDSRGMIIDVRANPGGSEPLANIIASLFTDKPIVYARSQFRNGPLHTDLTEPYERVLKPDEEGFYYAKPVVLLIGQGCASSNESFISALNELPQVTLVGDRTAGSSGNPTFVKLKLPVEVSVSIPQWIDLLPDGTPLEEAGIQPDVFVEASAEDFSGDNDPVLEKGLELLRNMLR